MQKKPTLQVGDMVRVEPRHWLRGNENGTIIDRNKDRFLIRFKEKRSNGGLNGNSLWLEKTQFVKV